MTPPTQNKKAASLGPKVFICFSISLYIITILAVIVAMIRTHSWPSAQDLIQLALSSGIALIAGLAAGFSFGSQKVS